MEISNRERDCIRDILDFWFGAPDSPGFGANRSEWWLQTDAFDANIRTTMLPWHDRAAAGELDHWVHDAHAGLVLIILLDQVPRNMFRGTARAFATDAHALRLAHRYVELELELDATMAPVYRLFAYLPLEHSENMADQDMSMSLMSALDVEGVEQAARQHRDIIDRFGRFPHRNKQLGRTSTPEEIEFLKQPNSSF